MTLDQEYTNNHRTRWAPTDTGVQHGPEPTTEQRLSQMMRQVVPYGGGAVLVKYELIWDVLQDIEMLRLAGVEPTALRELALKVTAVRR